MKWKKKKHEGYELEFTNLDTMEVILNGKKLENLLEVHIKAWNVEEKKGFWSNHHKIIIKTEDEDGKI